MKIPLTTALALFAAACLPIAAQETAPKPTATSLPGGPPPGSPPSLPAGMTVEEMWPPPTEADWAKPVLIEFERTWEDALAVANETRKPILVCINMDGEIASEHYAGVHYRTPETTKLFADYVCVIASVYRHTPRDHDENGERIPCPRFGSVTCGEHIAIEPLLYEKFMDGQRIAPRHIMVELDGRETYDVFYAWDNQSIFETIEEGIAERDIEPRTVVRGDRPIEERVASRALEDRLAVERAYRGGDRDTRRGLLEAALQNPDAAPVELLRLALYGVDEDLQKIARRALVQVDSVEAVDVLAEALRVPLEGPEREQLVAALERLRDRSPRARLLATVHRGLDAKSASIDVGGWNTAMAGGAVYAPPADFQSIERRVATREAAAAADAGDAAAWLDLAEASLELVLDPNTADRFQGDPRRAKQYGELMFQDARRQAEKAAELGASGWRLEAVLALVEYYVGDADIAYERSIRAAADMPAEPDSFVAVSTLALFAEARTAAIWAALRSKTDWPGEWATDVNAAYAVLAEHPLGTDVHIVTHFDFLDSLGAQRRAMGVLQRGLQRYPGSAALHDRLRTRLLADRGVDGLERFYARLLDQEGAGAETTWFAGYASIVAAEFHRRDGERAAARDAYRRAVDRFDTAIAMAPAFGDSADHYAALALAGLARVAAEEGDLEAATASWLAATARRPNSTPAVDGLNVSPAMTGRLLEARLEAAGRTELLGQVRDRIAELGPDRMALPAYENLDPNPEGRRRRRGGR